MAPTVRSVMDALYLFCVGAAGAALVLISAVIPWAVYTRYVLNRAASWPEPTAVLLMIVLTFFGGAACYRVGMHMRIIGHPARTAGLWRLLDHIQKHKDVWVTRRIDIANHWRATHLYSGKGLNE